MNYYNEFDPYAAQWLRNLIEAGEIPAGHVDTRSIIDVQPSDLAGYRQCHFFAGIGGWSLAARLAGWPDDRELWTGSAPCQPFSVAGKGKAQADDRHLWPHLFRLARARRPAVLMGEQVAAAVGQNWIDGVFDDLEGISYSCGAVVVPACAVNAPHRRDRLWFVAHVNGKRWDEVGCHGSGNSSKDREWEEFRPGYAVKNGVLANANGDIGEQSRENNGGGDQRGGAQPQPGSFRSSSGGGSVVSNAAGIGERESDNQDSAFSDGREARSLSFERGHWDGAGWVVGHDGKVRRVEPSIRLLAHGVSGRVGQLRAYGNAIVPQVAAEVIGAYMDCFPAGVR